MTTYGTAADAQQAVDHVRTIHERTSGTTAEGVPYRAGDPHLLGWVHAAEAHCFLRAHACCGCPECRSSRTSPYAPPARP
ncbi:oxygenase MpaB family protein [Streptomyces sp. 5K101]|uniref:oxygenase MpaB family protein n=1 Tax=Streptomyces sp. 5K101 TaxID=3390037 RepID=UPI00397504FD